MAIKINNNYPTSLELNSREVESLFINEKLAYLKPGIELILSGENQEGIYRPNYEQEAFFDIYKVDEQKKHIPTIKYKFQQESIYINGNKYKIIGIKVNKFINAIINHKGYDYYGFLSNLDLRKADDLTTISNAFNRTIISELTLNEGLEKISESFNYNNELKSIKINKELKSLDADSFKLNELNKIRQEIIVDSNNSTFTDNIDRKVGEKGLYSCNVIIDRATSKVIKGCATSVLQDNIKIIGQYAFQYIDLSSRKDFINLPSMDTIENSAFAYTDFPSNFNNAINVINIEDYAFYCSSLKNNLILKSQIRNIGYWSFGYTNIKSLEFEVPSESLYIKGKAFIQYPSRFYEVIKAPSLEVWNNIKFENTANPLSYLKYKSEGGTFQIPGISYKENNAILDYTGTDITEIKSFTFQGFKDLDTIKLSSSIKEINASAFANCANIQNIIGNSKFEVTETSPKLLKSGDTIVLGTVFMDAELQVNKVGDYAFSSRGYKKQVGNTVIVEPGCSIGEHAFESCSITKVNLDQLDKDSYIGDYAFSNNNITELEIPYIKQEGSYIIKSNAFDYNNITKVTIGECYTMQSLPTSVKEVEFINNEVPLHIKGEILNTNITIKGLTGINGCKIHSLNYLGYNNYIDPSEFIKDGDTYTITLQFEQNSNLSNYGKLGTQSQSTWFIKSKETGYTYILKLNNCVQIEGIYDTSIDKILINNPDKEVTLGRYALPSKLKILEIYSSRITFDNTLYTGSSLNLEKIIINGTSFTNKDTLITYLNEHNHVYDKNTFQNITLGNI